MSPDVVFWVLKCSEIRFRTGLCPGPHGGALSTPSVLAALWGPACKGGECSQKE